MQGYRFFACMPEGRKSKSASKAYPMPWTVATLKTYAVPTLPPGSGPRKYVECLAIDIESAAVRCDGHIDCAGALMADNDQAVCSSSCSREYLRKRCVRVPEALARELHPALFRYLG